MSLSNTNIHSCSLVMNGPKRYMRVVVNFVRWAKQAKHVVFKYHEFSAIEILQKLD